METCSNLRAKAPHYLSTSLRLFKCYCLLDAQLAQVRRLVVTHAVKEGHVDMGYRGNNHQGPETIIVDKRRRGMIPKRVWKWMKRRAAIEPTIGHLKAEHRLKRNRLKGAQGNAINALLSAACSSPASSAFTSFRPCLSINLIFGFIA